MSLTTKQFIVVNVGASANDGTGDSLRDAFIKVNSTFANIASVGFATGNVVASGGIAINSTQDASTVGEGALQVAGGASVAGNLVVGGSIYTDNLVTINHSALSVTDPLLYLDPTASYPYTYDIGFFSQFTGGPSNVYQHTGLVRSNVDNAWYLFSNIAEPTAGTVDVNSVNAVYDAIVTGAHHLHGDITFDGSRSIIGNISLNPTTELKIRNSATIVPSTGTTSTLSVATSEVDSSTLSFTATTTGTTISAGKTGTGSYQPLTFKTSNTDRIAITTDGNISFISSALGNKITIEHTTASVSTATGALVINGGLGVAGKINALEISTPTFTLDGYTALTTKPMSFASSDLYTSLTTKTGNGDAVFSTDAILTNTAITSGTLNNVVIGNVTPTTAHFTNLVATTATISSADFSVGTFTWPTFNQDTTGTASNITGIYGGTLASSQVTTALGYTPYNATNPNNYISSITSANVTTALGFTPYNATNPNGYTTNTGTVISVNGSGSVSGLTLSGNVSTTGNLTLGGTLSLTSANITTGLGYTPYNATNPNNYISASAPVTKTSSFTVSSTDTYIVCNGLLTVTMPSATTNSGRAITFKNISANVVISGSNNIVPLTSDIAGNLIVAGTAGKWTTVVSDGSNWIAMQGN